MGGSLFWVVVVVVVVNFFVVRVWHGRVGL